MIALVDYGAGNLTSVRKALTTLGADFETPRDPAACATAAGLIVPGVGNFAATQVLEGPWRDTIAAAVHRGTPLLEAASPTAEPVGTLREGEVVPILQRSGGYVRIEDSSGARGWARAEQVRPIVAGS